MSGSEILDVDLLAFERGDATSRRATVDGVLRSLANGFVYTSHDLGETLLDDAYGMLAEFFALPADTKARFVAPGSHGQTGYTGLLVETAAGSDHADWKEMLNWSAEIPGNHPLRTRYPHRYAEQVLPEAAVPGSREVLMRFHDRVFDLQRRFLRIIAVGLGAAEDFFEASLRHGPTLTRAIHYPPMSLAPGARHEWAGAHGDIASSPRCPAPPPRPTGCAPATAGVGAVAPEGRVIISTGMMLEHLTNGLIPAVSTGWWPGPASPGSAIRWCSSATHPVDGPRPLASCVTAEHPQRYTARCRPGLPPPTDPVGDQPDRGLVTARAIMAISRRAGSSG
ncbi:MAG: 2-oxoglutarate and iron-dependent oxygenase domain-containing protein [Acidimicrobiales bacterium]